MANQKEKVLHICSTEWLFSAVTHVLLQLKII